MLPVPEHGLPSSSSDSPEGTDSNSGIQYARQQIPEFEIPSYRGASYEDRVPDTLDLAHRAELGVNVLTYVLTH